MKKPDSPAKAAPMQSEEEYKWMEMGREGCGRCTHTSTQRHKHSASWHCVCKWTQHPPPAPVHTAHIPLYTSKGFITCPGIVIPESPQSCVHCSHTQLLTAPEIHATSRLVMQHPASSLSLLQTQRPGSPDLGWGRVVECGSRG